MKMGLTKWLEAIAVICSLLYTILITYNNILCWFFSLAASVLYLYLCFDRKIYAESALQLFYVFTTVYGYLNWGEGLSNPKENLNWEYHLIIILAGILILTATGYLLKKFTNAQRPFLDSFTTVFSIFATLLMINLYPSNWIYWIVIDSFSVYLYFKRKLFLTSVLFLIYTILSINGYLAWGML